MAAVEKHVNDMELCSQQIKTAFDNKFGGNPWSVVTGRAFSYDITHAKNYLMLFIGSLQIGVLVWST